MARKKADGRLPWFPVYAADTLSDERFSGWTCEERGAWFTLVLMCWREGSIPAQPEQLRRILHVDGPAFSVMWQAIGDRFCQSDDKPDRLVSPRLEKEREEARRVSRVRGEAGAKGGKAKSERKPTRRSNGVASVKQLLPHGQAIATHTTTPHTTEQDPTAQDIPSTGTTDGETPLVVALKHRVQEGLGHGLIPLAKGDAPDLERLLGTVGVEDAYWFLASTCRQQDSKPRSMAWVAKVLRERFEVSCA